MHKFHWFYRHSWQEGFVCFQNIGIQALATLNICIRRDRLYHLDKRDLGTAARKQCHHQPENQVQSLCSEWFEYWVAPKDMQENPACLRNWHHKLKICRKKLWRVRETLYHLERILNRVSWMSIEIDAVRMNCNILSFCCAKKLMLKSLLVKYGGSPCSRGCKINL